MTARQQTQLNRATAPAASFTPVRAGLLQRKCACGGTPGPSGECEGCRKKRQNTLQRRATGPEPDEVPPIVHEVLRSPGQPLDAATRALMEPRFGHDFGRVRIHSDHRGVKSAKAVNALAYSVGHEVVFGRGQYSPNTNEGQRLLAHELTHVVQQSRTTWNSGPLRIGGEDSGEEHEAENNASNILAGNPMPPTHSAPHILQRRPAPYIKKVTVHLTPPQSADLEWEGTPPGLATGGDHFAVSTGKGYGDPDDPPGTCTRNCCSDAMTQCAPPWNRADRVGACCTYHGDDFWTGTPQDEHNGWKWWTPIQPYYSSRGIALHQHSEVTGQAIGHGCVRMDEPNAKRIYVFSNGRQTNVTIDGRAAPVLCGPDRRCSTSDGGAGASLSEPPDGSRLAAVDAVPQLEGERT